jgi:hypothetical protein
MNKDEAEKIMSEEVTNPLLIVFQGEDGLYRFIVRPDLTVELPIVHLGIVLSDLLDHVAAVLAAINHEHPNTIHAELLNVMRKEDQLKRENPDRGNLKGMTVFSTRH